MKSIMQEASSIMKAIDTAWQAAGKPSEFTVKVFEEAEKNFIGFTTKPAKIGLFFQTPAHSSQQRKADDARLKQRTRTQEPARAQEHKKDSHQQQHTTPQPKKPLYQQPSHQPQQQSTTQERELQHTGPIWSEELIQKAREWMNGILKAVGKNAPSFETTADNYLLRVTLHQPLFEDAQQEREFFKHSSFLLLCSLKRTFKRPLRGYKIVIHRS